MKYGWMVDERDKISYWDKCNINIIHCDEIENVNTTESNLDSSSVHKIAVRKSEARPLNISSNVHYNIVGLSLSQCSFADDKSNNDQNR